MKIIGVIPARYASSRFPGKPLADICGKPMIWWVYRQVKRVTEFDTVYAAIDNEKIVEACKSYDIPFVLTRDDHPNHINRVHEVSEMVGADYYICVNGDEPLISPDTIRKILPAQVILDTEYFGGAMRTLTDPAETIDCANIKLAVTDDGYCVYMSRTAVPYPQGTLMFEFKKYVGIECFNKKALDFFVGTKMGRLERIEDIDHLRFLENGKKLHFTEVESESISVDTPKDLEKVKEMLKGQI